MLCNRQAGNGERQLVDALDAALLNLVGTHATMLIGTSMARSSRFCAVTVMDSAR
jgi:hypothetical protein